MPSEVMEQRGVSDSSHLLQEIRFPSEKQVRKLKAIPDHLVGMDSIGAIPGAGGKLDSSSPMHKLLPNMGQLMPQSDKAVRQSTGVVQGTNNISRATWKPMDNDIKLWSDLCVKPASYSFDGKNNLTNGIHHESSLFSSSLSEVFCRKLQLPGNDAIRHQPVNPVFSSNEDPFNCLEDIEGKTIGNLLPDDDDLFSGMTDVLGLGGHGNTGDEFEDFDLFSNGGGLELGDDRSSIVDRKYDLVGGMLHCQVSSNGPVTGGQPSRTLFVRNINSNVEDSELKALFERYGDIRTLYTASKHRGFVMISYYDIRAAHNAMRALQNQPMKHRNLDIHYSLPKDNPTDKDVNQGILMMTNLDSSVSNNELHQLFGIYGEIKQVHETPDKHRVIEFYDVRAAEMASRALNKTNISGKQIKLESAFNGGAGPSVVQLSNLEQDVQEANIFRSICDNLAAGQKAKVGPDGIASSCMAIGSNQSFHAAMRSPMMQSVDDGFSHQSSSLPNTLPSPMRMMSSTGKHFGFCESNNSLDEMKFANQGIQGFHPHSLPEHHDTHGIPNNHSAAIAQMTNLGGLGVTEGYASHIHGVNISRHPRDLKGVFGSFGSGSSNSVREQHCGWNNSSSYQQLSSSSMGLRNSPSFVNGLHEHRFPQTPGLPRPHILSSSSLPHHIGSAPAVNPSLWERHAYSPGNAGLHHLGSLGSAGGFPGSPQLHLMDIAASQKMFSQVGGSCMDMSTAQHSPHHMFPGRNQVSMPTSFDSLRENGRNFSQRRHEGSSNNLDKRQYDLDVDRILHGDDSRTTLMIKNIPNKYTSKMLLAAIDEHCRGTYDFLYLPIDFKNKCNVGYAFINMVDPRQIIPFHQAFNGKKWEKFNSEKVATLAYARIQGKTALIAHFQNSSLMNEDKRCRPILFHTDGPNAGDPEPFPMGTNIRSRSGRSRTNGNEENHQGSPSVSAIRDEAYDSASGSSKDSD